MKKPVHYTVVCTLILALSNAVAVAETPDDQHDERIGLTMSAADKAEFLLEMRQMLASIQGIISGIGTEDRELIFESAKYSGNRMARATPDSVRQILPQSFKEIGGPTHMMFEELAIRSETDEMDTLAEFTGQLMKQCLACHAMFKVNGQ